MILFVLTGQAPPILILALLILAYLTAWELRSEKDLQFQIKVWWVLLVLIFNLLGYGAFRLWLALRRHDSENDSKA
jgi:hypothetical protein